jgi:KDO2-lipid IV(A) lauroyltransferase
LRAVARMLGTLGYYCLRPYRKRTLSNLALATALALRPNQMKRLAKQAFQNLAINGLEYAKLARDKDLARVIQCENPEVAEAIYRQGKGIVFFCGHQANWEALFLDGTSRMKGIAIGKPIKNQRLYDWVVSMRERNGGKIISPRNAVRAGLKALREGGFVGIVGDQGMPGSGYAFPFLGRRAWTSTAPALLAYKTNSPIIFASIRRVPGGYRIHYSDPIWPDPNQPLEQEVVRLMDQTLTLLQESIRQKPGEWMWQHNRWKQQTMHNLYRRFRQDCICVILPEEVEPLLPHLKTLREIYAMAFLSFLVPEKTRDLIEGDEVMVYRTREEMLLADYRFKLVFNFTDEKAIEKHYEKLSALEVIDLPKLYKLAEEHRLPHHDLSDILKRALCRPGSIWQKEERALTL